MTEEKAMKATSLLHEIRGTKAAVRRLKDERAARATGLDPNAPGPRNYVLRIIDDEWGRIGEKCVAFFITAMDEAIENEEKLLAELTKELEEL